MWSSEVLYGMRYDRCEKRVAVTTIAVNMSMSKYHRSARHVNRSVKVRAACQVSKCDPAQRRFGRLRAQNPPSQYPLPYSGNHRLPPQYFLNPATHMCAYIFADTIGLPPSLLLGRKMEITKSACDGQRDSFLKAWTKSASGSNS